MNGKLQLEAVVACYRKSLTFTGRASRHEYWWFSAYFTALSVLSIGSHLLPIVLHSKHLPEVAVYMSGLLAGAINIFNIATYLPFNAVQVRRLHDVGRSGMWQLCLVLSGVASEALRIAAAAYGIGGLVEILLALVSVVFVVLLIAVLCFSGRPGQLSNKYGTSAQIYGHKVSWRS